MRSWRVRLADKGWDAGHFDNRISENGAKVVITPKRCQKVRRAYGADLDKECNPIVLFVRKLKPFRRVALEEVVRNRPIRHPKII